MSSFEIEPASAAKAEIDHHVDETDETDNDVESVPLTGNGHSRPRRQPLPDFSAATDSSGLLCIIWFILFVVFAVGIIGLLGYQRYDFKKHHKDDNASPGSSRNPKSSYDGHYGHGDDFVSPRHEHTVYYNPEAYLHNPDPFNLKEIHRQTPYYGSGIIPPRLFENGNYLEPRKEQEEDMLGYFQYPSVVNNTLVFCAEGDLFLTDLTPWQQHGHYPRLSAMKLTTTVGNVGSPKLHPSGLLVAYTATYSGRRDVYLMDLRGGYAPAMRVTYWDNSYGVSSLVGWNDEGTALIFKARSNSDLSVPDYRLYQISVQLSEGSVNRKSASVSPMTITPIPLAQAIDAAFYKDCTFFVRYSQSSKTIRYVGGTAEQMWVYQDGEELALRLLDDGRYRGTTKSPAIYHYQSRTYLFLLSDRSWDSDSKAWIPGRMNIWAVLLEDTDESSSGENNSLGQTIDAKEMIPVTDVSCEFDGRLIREYAVDPTSGHVTVRIGADMYLINRSDIHNKLKSSLRRLESSQESTRTTISDTIKRIPIVVHSDFHEQQERLIPVDTYWHMTSADIYETIVGTVQLVMTLRGQLWVAPVLETEPTSGYEGSGTNMPERRYRLAPGSMMGGTVRILKVVHVPSPVEDDENDRRLALILATDPLSPTAEHAFYLLETQWAATPLFLNLEDLPTPFLGGHVSGGPTSNGGLGSVKSGSLKISPCGRRLAWTDTDGRIVVMTMPQYQILAETEQAKYTILPKENEAGEPMIGDEANFAWSPGGRYLAVEHNARNQFRIISIVDCGEPQHQDEATDISLGRIVQATNARFNSEEMYWGKTVMDIHAYERNSAIASVLGTDPPESPESTTLFYLTDRDIRTDVDSPWGTRQPSPHFKASKLVYALPLVEPVSDDRPEGLFPGGGASEIHVDLALQRKKLINSILDSGSSADQASRRKLSHEVSPLAGVFQWAEALGSDRRRELESTDEEEDNPFSEEGSNVTASFPEDLEIDFGSDDGAAFGSRAYRVAGIPSSTYTTILSQTDDGSIVLVNSNEGSVSLEMFVAEDFPSSDFKQHSFDGGSGRIGDFGLSSSRKFFFLSFSSGAVKVVPNTIAGLGSLLSEDAMSTNIADTDGMHLSVWPSIEYRQLYGDAWRMLRDYFYDTDMTGIDWESIFDRYYPLVTRCTKREELDDVLAQMASELSALHVFVYGGEYNTPMGNDPEQLAAHQVASLGASLEHAPEWNGFRVVSVPERDPDFNVIDGGRAVYSPLSDRSLRLSGQRGLKPGDVIVGVNGESVAHAPYIGAYLRGMSGEAVRLDVLRLASGNKTQDETDEEADNAAQQTEPLVVVPLSSTKASDLQYHSWEWKTEQLAQHLAQQAGFSVGYVHLRDMSGPEAEDAFARGFFPNYDKEAFILDLRHNSGKNDHFMFTSRSLDRPS